MPVFLSRAQKGTELSKKKRGVQGAALQRDKLTKKKFALQGAKNICQRNNVQYEAQHYKEIS